MKKWFVLILVVLAVGGGVTWLWWPQSEPTTGRHLTINDAEFEIEEVRTSEAQSLGLSGRSGIAADQAMLFVYETANRPGIWMKDMNFSIDVLWLDETGTVVYLVDDTSPESYPTVYQPGQPALFVLEMSADAIESHHIALGDHVEGL